jgi:hypothetical protein
MVLKCGPQRLQRPSIDLCFDCMAEFTGWLDARKNGSTAPTPRASKHNRTAAGVRPGL